VATGGQASAEAPGAEGFAGTLFQAALDASQGQQWARQSPGGSERWWGTQGRRLDASVRICGVWPDLKEPKREACAAALRVPLLVLGEGASAIRAEAGYRSRGQAVREVLEHLSTGPCVLWRLLAGGQLVGLWGEPYTWDTARGRLTSLSFQGLGTDSG
jgi:hypothetical protein